MNMIYYCLCIFIEYMQIHACIWRHCLWKLADSGLRGSETCTILVALFKKKNTKSTNTKFGIRPGKGPKQAKDADAEA